MAHHTCGGTEAPEEKEGGRTHSVSWILAVLMSQRVFSGGHGMRCEILVATTRQLCERGAMGKILIESGLLLLPK